MQHNICSTCWFILYNPHSHPVFSFVICLSAYTTLYKDSARVITFITMLLLLETAGGYALFKVCGLPSLPFVPILPPSPFPTLMFAMLIMPQVSSVPEPWCCCRVYNAVNHSMVLAPWTVLSIPSRTPHLIAHNHRRAIYLLDFHSLALHSVVCCMPSASVMPRMILSLPLSISPTLSSPRSWWS